MQIHGSRDSVHADEESAGVCGVGVGDKYECMSGIEEMDSGFGRVASR